MSTFSKPAIVVDTISDAIMAKISNHVPSEQVHSESPAHWWSDEPATLKASVAGAVIMDKDGNFFEIFKDKPVITISPPTPETVIGVGRQTGDQQFTP